MDCKKESITEEDTHHLQNLEEPVLPTTSEGKKVDSSSPHRRKETADVKAREIPKAFNCNTHHHHSLEEPVLPTTSKRKQVDFSSLLRCKETADEAGKITTAWKRRKSKKLSVLKSLKLFISSSKKKMKFSPHHHKQTADVEDIKSPEKLLPELDNAQRKEQKYGFAYMREGLRRLEQQRAAEASFYEDTTCENWKKNEDLPSDQFRVAYHMSAIEGANSDKKLKKHVISEAKKAFCHWYMIQIGAAQQKHSDIFHLKSLLKNKVPMTKEEMKILNQLESLYYSFKEYLMKEKVTFDQKHIFLKLHLLELTECMNLLKGYILSRIHGSKARDLTEIINVGEALSRICNSDALDEGWYLKRIVHEVNLLKKIKVVTFILENTVTTLNIARPLSNIFSEDETSLTAI